MRLYTVGHSSHTHEEFLQLLQENDVDYIVDVRSVPASKMGRLLRIFCGNRASVFVNEHVCLPLHRKSTDGPRQEAEKARQTV